MDVVGASGQTWPGAAASFLGETRLGPLTALVSVGYFFVWTAFGIAAYPLGVAWAALEMRQPELARVVPIAVGLVVLIAGSLQLTAWKARHLAWCREAPGRGRTLPADAGTAWRHGLRLGLRCSQCCSGWMATLLALGVMELRAMAVVAAAITVERLAPAGERVARATGAVALAVGLLLIARAAGPLARVRPPEPPAAGVRYSTTIVPRIPLVAVPWSLQWYSYVPAELNAYENEPLPPTVWSKTSVEPGLLVTVCTSEVPFCHVTIAPSLTVSVIGSNVLAVMHTRVAVGVHDGLVPEPYGSLPPHDSHRAALASAMR